jgi:hypothetical protein
MLAHLQQHIAATLAPARQATLSTSGPAGLQASVVPCASRGTRLYLLLLRTSDQLLNLEHEPAVVVTTAAWQVTGRARILDGADRWRATMLLQAPEAPWSEVIEVRPTRVAIAHQVGYGAAETIDLE